MHAAASACLDPRERAVGLRGDARSGRAGLPLLEGLPDAHDRRHAVLVHRLELLVHGLVGLAEQLTALGVADDHVLHLQLGQHRWAHLAGVRALVLPVAVLRSELDP